MVSVLILLSLALGITTLTLTVKIYLMKKSAKEICRQLGFVLAEETNTLICISSSDPSMKRLAAEINQELRLLRKERRRYLHGDRELKEAVTNISHDLRTPLTAICGYLDMLEEEEKSENACRYLAQIQNRTEVLKQLTEELFRSSGRQPCRQLQRTDRQGHYPCHYTARKKGAATLRCQRSFAYLRQPDQ